MRIPNPVHASRPMRATLGTLCMAGLLLAGCVVTSVYPFYRETDLAFEPALLGEWVAAEADAQSNEILRVERWGRLGYRATICTERETNSVICHLFRLQDQLFLDTCPTNHSFDLIPVHQVSKVTRVTPEFENASLNYKWLESLLKENPRAIRHLIVRDKFEGQDEARIVLTADTAELQKFILKHLNNSNAWTEPSRVKRPPSRR